MIAVIGQIALIVGLVTAIIDMMMNGGRYAGWAPFGLLMAGGGVIAMWFG